MLALPVLLLLGACASADVGQPPSGSASPSGPASGSAPGSPSGSPSSSPPLSRIPPPVRLPSGPPKEPTDVIQRVTLVGTVDELGAGCVTFTSDVGVHWALIGPATRDLAVGMRVEVVGRGLPTAMPACAGAPLRVESAVEL